MEEAEAIFDNFAFMKTTQAWKAFEASGDTSVEGVSPRRVRLSLRCSRSVGRIGLVLPSGSAVVSRLRSPVWRTAATTA